MLWWEIFSKIEKDVPSVGLTFQSHSIKRTIKIRCELVSLNLHVFTSRINKLGLFRYTPPYSLYNSLRKYFLEINELI